MKSGTTADNKWNLREKQRVQNLKLRSHGFKEK